MIPEWCGSCRYQRVRADGTPSPGHLAECGPGTPPPAPPAAAGGRPDPHPWVEPAPGPPPGSEPGWQVIREHGHARGGGAKTRIDYIASGSRETASSPAARTRALTGDAGYMFKGDPPGGVTYRAGEILVTCDVFRRPAQDRWRDVPCGKHVAGIDPACLECRAERVAKAWLAVPRGGPPGSGTLRAAYQPPGTVIYAVLPGVTELAKLDGQPDQEDEHS